MKKTFFLFLGFLTTLSLHAQVTLYSEANFKGSTLVLGEGNYKMIPVQFKNNLRSVQIKGNFTAEIFSLPNFTGKRINIITTETSVPESWGGQTGSLKIIKYKPDVSDTEKKLNAWDAVLASDTIPVDEIIPANWSDSGKVILFSECHYSGKKKLLSPGNFSATNSWSISSIKIPADKYVFVYSKQRYKGASQVFTSDDNCIHPSWNNKVQSIKIIAKTKLSDDDSIWTTIGIGGLGIKGSGSGGGGYGSGGSGRINSPQGSGGGGDWGPGQRTIGISKVVVFDNCNFSGSSRALGNGAYPAMPAGFSGKISAIRVPNGKRIQIYSGKNFTGVSKLITADASCLPPAFNNKVESLKIADNSNLQ